MNKSKLLSHFGLLIANLIFGFNYPIAKSLMPFYFRPAQIILFRSGIAFIVFFTLQKLLIKEKIEKKDLIRLIFCGLFGVTINQFMFFAGLEFTSPVDASIIMVINPILVLILSYFIIKEKNSFSKIIGIAAGLSGALIIIIYGKEINVVENRFLGNLFIFINAASYAIYLILIKPLTRKYKPITIMSWTFLFGFLFMTPSLGYAFNNFDFSKIPVNMWLSLLYVVVASTIIAYLLISYSLINLSPVSVSFYIYIQPLIASIITMVMFNETINIIQIFAALLIFFGVYMVNSSNFNLIFKIRDVFIEDKSKKPNNLNN